MNSVLLKSIAGIGALLLSWPMGWTPFLLFLSAFAGGLCLSFLSELGDEEKIFWTGGFLGVSGGLMCFTFLSIIPGTKFFFGVFFGCALAAVLLYFSLPAAKKEEKIYE